MIKKVYCLEWYEADDHCTRPEREEPSHYSLFPPPRREGQVGEWVIEHMGATRKAVCLLWVVVVEEPAK